MKHIIRLHIVMFCLIIGIDVSYGQNTTWYGTQAGSGGLNNSNFGVTAGKVTTGSDNAFMGFQAGLYNTSGYYNVFSGSYSGYSNTTSYYNTFIGFKSGFYISTGVANLFIGGATGLSTTTGGSNTFLGTYSGNGNTTGSCNVFIGASSGYYSTTGSSNVCIGYAAGQHSGAGTGNVFIGNASAQNETGSNKLYIANSNTITPLIYGEFNNGFVSVNGKLGIGSGTPIGKFQVGTQYRVFLDDNICMASTGWKTNMIGFNAVRRSDGLWETKGDNSFNGGAVIASDVQGGFHFYSFPSTGTGTATYTDAQFVSKETFSSDYYGNLYVKNALRIGTSTNSDAYSLSVDGKIIAEEVVIKLSQFWPDYVFSNSYKIRTLDELESFIKENNHLPNVPSAEDVKENGIGIGEMNKILLEKVEETTLYLIELKKQNDQLIKRIEELEKNDVQ